MKSGKLEKGISEFFFFNLTLFEKVENWKSRKVKKWTSVMDGMTNRQTGKETYRETIGWMDQQRH